MRACVAFEGFETRSGRVYFRVRDDQGPLITIHSTANNNQRVALEFYVTPQVLAELSDMFDKASSHFYKTKPHFNQGESLLSLAQGDIDAFGDVIPCGYFGSGGGKTSGSMTYTSKGRQCDETLQIYESCLDSMEYVPGTVRGEVHRVGEIVQTFNVLPDGRVILTAVGTPLIYVTEARFDHKLGSIRLHWNARPGENYCVFDYEFAMVDSPGYKQPDEATLAYLNSYPVGMDAQKLKEYFERLNGGV